MVNCPQHQRNHTKKLSEKIVLICKVLHPLLDLEETVVCNYNEASRKKLFCSKFMRKEMIPVLSRD